MLLAWVQEQDGSAVAIVPRRPPDSVDVRVGVLRAINLDNPVDGGEVDAASNYIGCEEAGMLGDGKPPCDLQSGALLLPSVEIQEGDARLQMPEGLEYKPYLLA